MQKFITLILFLALNTLFAQNAKEYSDLAQNAYRQNNYTQAKEYFLLSLAENNSAQTNYNLANTCEKLGEIGFAKAYYMRAIYQNPRFKEAIFNLNALDKKYSLAGINNSKVDKFFDELSHNEWIILSAIFLWLATLVLIILPVLKIRKPWQYFLGIVFLAAFTLCVFAISYWNSYANTAVATVDNAQIKLSPTDTSSIASTLKQGQLIFLKKKQGDFYQATNNAGKKGWIKLDNKTFASPTRAQRRSP